MPTTENLPVAVFSAGCKLISPAEFIRRFARDFMRSRHVVREMFRRDLTSQYRQTLLGFLLSILPALTITAWAILFRSAHLINVGSTTVPYPFFVLCGMMIWSAFLDAIDAPIQGVLSEQALLSKSSIPPEAVTFARLGQVFVNFAAKAVMVGIAAALYRIHAPWTIVFAPVGVALVVALGTGLGLVLAPINLIYRDVSKVLPVITTFWFFLTPIVFVSPRQGVASLVMEELNPVTRILVSTRNLMLPGTAGPPEALWGAAIFAIGLLCFGLVFHRIAMPIVIDRANA
jgi:lipopolysaccharide transport system permease protein